MDDTMLVTGAGVPEPSVAKSRAAAWPTRSRGRAPIGKARLIASWEIPPEAENREPDPKMIE